MSGHLDGPSSYTPREKVEAALRFYADRRNWVNGREFKVYAGCHGSDTAARILAELDAGRTARVRP